MSSFLHYFITSLLHYYYYSIQLEKCKLQSDRTEVGYSFPVNDLNLYQEHLPIMNKSLLSSYLSYKKPDYSSGLELTKTESHYKLCQENLNFIFHFHLQL